MISAEQARNMAEQLTDNDIADLEELEKCIKFAIEWGRNYITTGVDLKSKISDELRRLGYTVEYMYSPKNDSGYKISW